MDSDKGMVESQVQQLGDSMDTRGHKVCHRCQRQPSILHQLVLWFEEAYEVGQPLN